MDQFPNWLKNNKGKISEEDYKRYETQEALIKRVCTILEKEESTEDAAVKHKRYEEVLDLMVKVRTDSSVEITLDTFSMITMACLKFL